MSSGSDDQAAQIRLEIPAKLDYLATVRLVLVAAAALEPALPESRIDDIRLAVSEACSNAIKAHNAGPRPDDPVIITCALSDDAVLITITDGGHGFDPASLSTLPDPTDPERLKHESGLGIPLINVLADEVEFTSSDLGTTVSMRVLRTTETHTTPHA